MTSRRASPQGHRQMGRAAEPLAYEPFVSCPSVTIRRVRCAEARVPRRAGTPGHAPVRLSHAPPNASPRATHSRQRDERSPRSRLSRPVDRSRKPAETISGPLVVSAWTTTTDPEHTELLFGTTISGPRPHALHHKTRRKTPDRPTKPRRYRNTNPRAWLRSEPNHVIRYTSGEARRRAHSCRFISAVSAGLCGSLTRLGSPRNTPNDPSRSYQPHRSTDCCALTPSGTYPMRCERRTRDRKQGA